MLRICVERPPVADGVQASPWTARHATALPPLSHARAGATAVLVSESKVMILGGLDNSYAPLPPEMLDLGGAGSEVLPPMHHPRGGLGYTPAR